MPIWILQTLLWLGVAVNIASAVWSWRRADRRVERLEQKYKDAMQAASFTAFIAHDDSPVPSALRSLARSMCAPWIREAVKVTVDKDAEGKPEAVNVVQRDTTVH